MPSTVEVVRSGRVPVQQDGTKFEVVFRSSDRDVLTATDTKHYAISLAEEAGVNNAAINGFVRVIPLLDTGDKVTGPGQQVAIFEATYKLG